MAKRNSSTTWPVVYTHALPTDANRREAEPSARPQTYHPWSCKREAGLADWHSIRSRCDREYVRSNRVAASKTNLGRTMMLTVADRIGNQRSSVSHEWWPGPELAAEPLLVAWPQYPVRWSDERAFLTLQAKNASGQTWDDVYRNVSQIQNLRDDWDGAGAVAAACVVAICLQMIEIYRNNQSLPPDSVRPTPDGHIALEWLHNGSRFEFEVSADTLEFHVL